METGYVDCILVVRRPDNAQSSDRKMLVKKNNVLLTIL